MRVGLLSNDGESIVEVFPSAVAAAEEFGVSERVMQRAVRLGQRVRKKYRFVEVKEKEVK